MVADAEQARNAETKATIFISYSRKDLAFVDRLEPALKARGFEPLIDRAEIYAFEDWWHRIEGLIGNADTVVFVLSPDAVASEICAKEVGYAASLNKRFAPIVCRRVEDGAVPEPLRRLNFVFFDSAADFDASVARLAEALQTDIGWIRKHTEYGEAGRRWSAAGRPDGLLLRSPALEEAEQWIASRPSSAPVPTAETQAFISESRRGATRRRNILTGGLAAGLVIALVLAGLAYWQRGVAVAQRQYAERALDAGIRTSNSLSLDLAAKLRNQPGIQSSLVKYLIDSALTLQDKLGSNGRVTPDLLDGEARALLESAKTLRTIGDISGAFSAAQRAQQTFERLLVLKPNDAATRINIATSTELMGDMLLAQGKTDDALAAYRAALTATQAVADADPKNEDAQQNIAVDYVHIGDALSAQLKSADALAAYQMSLAIRQKFADQNRNNVAWQRGLGISYERIANALLAQHKTDEALAAAQRRLAIAQALAGANGDDTQLQRELSVADNELGNILLAAGKPQEALGYYQKGLAIRQNLADSDQGNASWQRDLAISENHMGDVLAAGDKIEDALAAYQKGLVIERKLGQADPNNTVWQRDIAISDTKIGNILKNEGKLAEAQQAFGDCAAIAKRIITAHPDDQQWHNAFGLCVTQMGFVSYRFTMARDYTHALAAAEQAIALEPDMIWLNAHRAHALMFLGRTDEARALYLKYRDDKDVFGNKAKPVTWATLITQEFAELRQAGQTNPLMDDVEKQLAAGG